MAGVDRSPGRVVGLPAEISSFVDRRAETAEVKRLLSVARLVTLTGAGGVGKSRLALRAVTELRRGFPGGLCRVDLSTLNDDTLIGYAVAAVLGLDHRGPRPVHEVLVEYLRDRRALLVLDNCEHVLTGCAGLVDALLRGAAGLRVLCTSRQALGAPGEHVWIVPPMVVPGPGEAPAEAAVAPAVVLFVERARAVAPGFTLGPRVRDAVVEICRRLDGLPLAIELAAAQMRTLSVEQLARALDDRFRVLSTRHATPRRHRTLQATFDWSYELCTPAERSAWERLSVFVASFDLAAAEYVCADAGLPPGGLLDLVAGLVEKSVLVRDERPGGVRYRLLDTVREYGLDRLRATGGGEAALRRRHLDWYLGLAERFGAEWFGPDQREWTERIRLEYPNLRALLGACLGPPGDVPAAQRLAGNLVYHWLPAGALPEGRYWLERVLAADTAPTAARARVLNAAVPIIGTLDLAAGKVLAEEGLALARRLDDPVLIAGAAAGRGVVACLNGDDAAAYDWLTDALDRFGDLAVAGPLAAMASVTLGSTVVQQGRPAEGVEIMERMLAACRERGELWWQGYAYSSLSWAAVAVGDLTRAAEHVRQALRIARPFGDSLSAGIHMERLAWIAADTGEADTAARLLGGADAIWRRIGRAYLDAPQWRRSHRTCESRARDALGGAAFEAAFAWGGRLDEARAVAFALGDEGPAAAAGPADPGAGRPLSLTSRQRQVAELVADGLSNKEIAARLTLSRRTAESHVENILRKLGLTSRTQVAAWVAAARSADRPSRGALESASRGRSPHA
jgi:non-specific serine/threonine protein kinase